MTLLHLNNRGSSVEQYGMEDGGVDQSQEIFIFSKASARIRTQWITRSLRPAKKWPRIGAYLFF